MCTDGSRPAQRGGLDECERRARGGGARANRDGRRTALHFLIDMYGCKSKCRVRF